MARRTLVWRGLDLPLMEIGGRRSRVGAPVRRTQIGVAYELRYELEPGRLRAEIVGGPSIDLGLEGTDFFDLGYSPLFNSLPVLAGLEAARDFVATFVHVPGSRCRSEQRYEPLRGDRLVRYSSGSFVAEIAFDEEGFVTRYEGLAESRLGGGAMSCRGTTQSPRVLLLRPRAGARDRTGNSVRISTPNNGWYVAGEQIERRKPGWTPATPSPARSPFAGNCRRDARRGHRGRSGRWGRRSPTGTVWSGRSPATSGALSASSTSRRSSA